MNVLLYFYDAKWLLLYITLGIYLANKYRKYRRLQAFPGPFSTGWSELWHAFTIWSGDCHLKYKEVNDKYGPIARVGPNDLITCSPELLAHMSAVRSPYTRSMKYRESRVKPGEDHVFSQIDEEKHRIRRHQMASGYSGKENLELESDVDQRVQELIHLIRTKYLSTVHRLNPVDIAEKIQYFTLDAISSIGFGHPFGMLTGDLDVNDYLASIEEGLGIMTFTGAFGLNNLLQWPLVARLFGPAETDKGGMGRMMFMARNVIDARLAKPTQGRSDMLAAFMRHGLDREDLFRESLFQLVAGSDTSATAIRSILLYLITHPQVYKRLQAEVDVAAVSDGFKSYSKTGIPSVNTLKAMPYLQAVVREGLRMHPPVADSVPKRVPENGDKVFIDGKDFFLPGGTNISSSVWSLHRNRAIYGDDADCFRPERWLLDEANSEERLTTMRRTIDMVFGYGKYQCLGKPVAWMEISKVIFEFSKHFEWSLVSPEKPWKSRNCYGIFVQKEMWVTVTER